MRQFFIMLTVGVLLLAAPHAQEAPPDDPAALKALLAKKDAQIAALQQQAAPKLSPAETLAREQSFFAETFKAYKASASEACRKQGGKLWVMVTQGPARPTISVSCEGL